MIVSKAPFRVSFFGGGTDIPAYYSQGYPSKVLSCSIDKFCYVCLNKSYNSSLRLSYSQTENVDNVYEVQHPLFRETLKFLGIKNGLELTSIADIPSSGSGLGSSSSFTVALLSSLYSYLGKKISLNMLAENAAKIEIELCNSPIGKQDQYIASYGGLTTFEFKTNSTNVTKKNFSLISQFSNYFGLYFTGITRSASKELLKQSSNFRNKDKIKSYEELVSYVDIGLSLLKSKDIASFGRLLEQSWKIKKSFSSSMSNTFIDDAYDIAMKNGAWGGKILGAGGGGFLLICAKPEILAELPRLFNMSRMNFSFQVKGVDVKYV